jgi:hypothetical protein
MFVESKSLIKFLSLSLHSLEMFIVNTSSYRGRNRFSVAALATFRETGTTSEDLAGFTCIGAYVIS